MAYESRRARESRLIGMTRSLFKTILCGCSCYRRPLRHPPSRPRPAASECQRKRRSRRTQLPWRWTHSASLPTSSRTRPPFVSAEAFRRSSRFSRRARAPTMRRGSPTTNKHRINSALLTRTGVPNALVMLADDVSRIVWQFATVPNRCPWAPSPPSKQKLGAVGALAQLAIDPYNKEAIRKARQAVLPTCCLPRAARCCDALLGAGVC